MQLANCSTLRNDCQSAITCIPRQAIREAKFVSNMIQVVIRVFAGRSFKLLLLKSSVDVACQRSGSGCFFARRFRFGMNEAYQAISATSGFEISKNQRELRLGKLPPKCTANQKK